MTEIITQRLELEKEEDSLYLLGRFDENLNLIEKHFNVRLIPRGNELIIEGEKNEVSKLHLLFNTLTGIIRKGHYISTRDFEYALMMAREGQAEKVGEIFSDVVIVSRRGRQIRPKTLGQKKYLEAMRECDIVLSIGPAGTGKTYLALARAIDALQSKTCLLYTSHRSDRNNRGTGSRLPAGSHPLQTRPAAFLPVSYTHLDVYKRQSVEAAEPRRGRRWRPVPSARAQARRKSLKTRFTDVL